MNTKPSKGPLVLSLLVITVGVGWLLTVQQVGLNIDWVWTLGLAVAGVLTFLVGGGIDKSTVVVGPLLLVGSVFSILRQTGRLSLNLEVPIFVILLGVLLFIAQLPMIPPPRWYVPGPRMPEKE